MSLRFVVPSAFKCEKAIGREYATPEIAPFLQPHDTLFPIIPAPKLGEWLHEFPQDEDQTFAAFKHTRHNKINQRDTVYLLPVGQLAQPLKDSLIEFARKYLCMKVEWLPTVDIYDKDNVDTLPDFQEKQKNVNQNTNIDVNSNNMKKKKSRKNKISYQHVLAGTHVALRNNTSDSQRTTFVTYRENEWAKCRQLLTGDLLHTMKWMLPQDAYCMLALTMYDLYPKESWNFVFGEASLEDRVGVFSLCRQHPKFPGNLQASLSDSEYQLFLIRSAKVMIHEIIHMFGVGHCKYYWCIMNGANTLEESDSQPLHVCPIELHKLYDVVKFDPKQRYIDLYLFYRTLPGFIEEAEWIEKRLHSCHIDVPQLQLQLQQSPTETNSVTTAKENSNSNSNSNSNNNNNKSDSCDGVESSTDNADAGDSNGSSNDKSSEEKLHYSIRVSVCLQSKLSDKRVMITSTNTKPEQFLKAAAAKFNLKKKPTEIFKWKNGEAPQHAVTDFANVMQGDLLVIK